MIDFQGFVDLALDTSDATDMTITVLTDLRTIGSSIFQFLQLFTSPNSCGFDELVAACKVFWAESFDYRSLVICTCVHHMLILKLCIRVSTSCMLHG